MPLGMVSRRNLEDWFAPVVDSSRRLGCCFADYCNRGHKHHYKRLPAAFGILHALRHTRQRTGLPEVPGAQLGTCAVGEVDVHQLLKVVEEACPDQQGAH